jgi:hypothetical protein
MNSPGDLRTDLDTMMRFAGEANPGDYEEFCRTIQAALPVDDPRRKRVEMLTAEEDEGPVCYDAEAIKRVIRRNAAWRRVLGELPAALRSEYMLQLSDPGFYPDCLYDEHVLCSYVDTTCFTLTP